MSEKYEEATLYKDGVGKLFEGPAITAALNNGWKDSMELKPKIKKQTQDKPAKGK